jgi:hypothetical protein
VKVAWRPHIQLRRVTPGVPAAEPCATAGVSPGLHVACIRSANACPREYNDGGMPPHEGSSQKSGITAVIISRIENGQRQARVPTVKQLMAEFGIEPRQVVAGPSTDSEEAVAQTGLERDRSFMDDNQGTSEDWRLSQLEEALAQVEAYHAAWKAGAARRHYSDTENATIRDARRYIMDRIGPLKRDVHESTGKQLVTSFGRTIDMWDLAFAVNPLEASFGPGLRIAHISHLEDALREAVSLSRDAVARRTATRPIAADAEGVNEVMADPPELADSLARFRADYADPTKVGFIMMRFGKTPAHDAIVTAIRSAVEADGGMALRADDRQYNRMLFENIRTYMHGCGFGIAVFERLEVQEFNPNVALEVGYMMALNKPVCLLKDQTLTALQADLGGELYKSFDPQRPMETIPPELSKWMTDWRVLDERRNSAPVLTAAPPAAEHALSLSFETGERVDSPGGPQHQVVALRLVNDSPQTVSKFRFDLELPFMPRTLEQPASPVRSVAPIQPLVGKELAGKDWQRWRTHRRGGRLFLEFRSEGQASVWPKGLTVVCEFWLVAAWYGLNERSDVAPTPTRYECEAEIEAEGMPVRQVKVPFDFFELIPGRY